MWYKFDRITNSCAVCFVSICAIAAIMVKIRFKVPSFETFGDKCEPFVLLNHGARVRRNDVHLVEVKLSKEGVICR